MNDPKPKPYRTRPGYSPPWGRPLPVKKLRKVHPRWIDQLEKAFGRVTAPMDPVENQVKNQVENQPHPPKPRGDWSLAQCGGCSYYVPLEGILGADWGVCVCEKSQHDRTAVFEHFGCYEHSHAHMIVEEDRKPGEGTGDVS